MSLRGASSEKRPLLKRVCVIGLGLMGGSLGLALRRAGVAEHIVGCGREVLLRRAQEMGAIDSGTVDALEAVAECDYVFLCTPVETSIAVMARIAPRLSAGSAGERCGQHEERVRQGGARDLRWVGRMSACFPDIRWRVGSFPGWRTLRSISTRAACGC